MKIIVSCSFTLCTNLVVIWHHTQYNDIIHSIMTVYTQSFYKSLNIFGIWGSRISSRIFCLFKSANNEDNVFKKKAASQYQHWRWLHHGNSGRIYQLWVKSADHLVVSLLAVVGLVASLVAGIRVLFVRPLLAVGFTCCGRFLLRRRSSHEGSNDARLLEDEPEVSHPQDQVNKTKSLEEEMMKEFIICVFSSG